MPEWAKWAIGVLFSLVVGAYGYASRIDSSIDGRIDKVETRIADRLDRLEEKIDRLIERGH